MFPPLSRAAMLAAALSTVSALAVEAGDAYTAANGFAVSGYDVVAYWDMADDQAPIGGDQPDAVPGRADLTAEHDGATYAFASAGNRDRFVANPEAFVPQYDGHCAYGAAKGGKVPGNPHLWRILDGKLYLNITENVVTFWEEDIPGNLELSEANWVSLEPEPASDRPIPQFEPAAPLAP